MDHANNAVYADWLDEAVIACGRRRRGDARGPPTRRGWSSPSPPSGARPSRPRPGGAEDGWSCRLSDAAGTELLRARLEPA